MSSNPVLMAGVHITPLQVGNSGSGVSVTVNSCGSSTIQSPSYTLSSVGL